ncbi:MAG: cyclic pyranopterin monophosphate synthase MoaC [Propionibacterium sp.]
MNDHTNNAAIRLPHLNARGDAFMVDVTAKQPSIREATAVAEVGCSEPIMAALRGGRVPKGDVLAVARIAGIQAAKRTPDLLPLAHVIGVHSCQVDVTLEVDHVAIRSTVRTADRTGVEMEALTSAAVAALAVVDMVKGVDRTAVIREAKIIHKTGGRSGEWTRPDH